MSCRRASWLTNDTRVPMGTVSSFGLTPLEVSVNVYGLLGVGDGAGAGLLPPPHEARSRQRMRTQIATAQDYQPVTLLMAIESEATESPENSPQRSLCFLCGESSSASEPRLYRSWLGAQTGHLLNGNSA